MQMLRASPHLVERLRTVGLRLTRPRLALARLLFDGGDRHITAEQLHGEATAASISVSLATVYNVLHQFTAAGLLRDRPATTYWSAFDELLALDPSISARPDDRFVDDGNVITAAGVSAGIDMALHLVRRLDSEDAARATKRGIEYDPRPPV